jgi:hypothetical protein
LEKHAPEKQETSFGKTVIYQIYKTLNHYFEDIIDNLSFINDPRKSRQYGIDEIVMGGISMFLFKEDSRNAFNNDRKEPLFAHNYTKLFKKELPHMDTVKDVFCPLDCAELENIKAEMIAKLIRNKVLADQRFQGRYIIAVDGTGIVSYEEHHCDCCLTKTSKNGKVTYFHNVLEAKLITNSGLSLSVASEWINNEGKSGFDKQDCERNAFNRLAAKIKAYYPRLPIIILADGLYPYQGFFDICHQNQWKFIVTLQDKNLKKLQEEICWEKRITPKQKMETCRKEKGNWVTLNYHWLKDLEYNEHSLGWVECLEKTINGVTKKESLQRFVHLTDLEMGLGTCQDISYCGRLRQKIENEGFNTQKNHGYNLEHKFVRCSFNAMKNFYQCLQIAHIINQLVTLSSTIGSILKTDKKLTIKYLWKRLSSFFLEGTLQEEELPALFQNRCQIRLE